VYWDGNGWTQTQIWNDVALNQDNSWSLPDVDFSAIATYRILHIANDNAGNFSGGLDNPATNFNTTP